MIKLLNNNFHFQYSYLQDVVNTTVNLIKLPQTTIIYFYLICNTSIYSINIPYYGSFESKPNGVAQCQQLLGCVILHTYVV